MELGSCMDDGLNEMLRPVLLGRGVDLERGLQAMRDRLEHIPDDLADAAQRIAEGKALESALHLFWLDHEGWLGQDVQFRFEATWKGIPIVGVIDRIDADGTLVDHKLTRSQHAKDGVLGEEWLAERRPQLALYLACLAITQGEEVGARVKAQLDVCYVTAKLKTPQWVTAKLEIGQEEQLQALENASTAAYVRDSGVYPAKPGKQCGWCDFTAECGMVQTMLSLDIVRIAGEVE